MAKNDYDIIVIGSGIGGLTCAAYLSKAGFKVLVLEQAEIPGGYCSSFTKEGFTFDAAMHFIEGGAKDNLYQDSILLSILKDLGAEKDIELVKFTDLYTIFHPAGWTVVLRDFIDFLFILYEKFPQEKDGLFRLYKLINKLGDEIRDFVPKYGALDLMVMPVRFPVIFKIYNKTFQQVLDEFIKDEQLKFLFSAMIFMFLGLPPQKLSALMGLSFFYFIHYEGLFYPKGGAQSLPKALIRCIERNNGQVKVSTKVEKIILDNKCVKGVLTNQGEEITASKIVSNADARHTFQELIGREHIPSKLDRKLEEFRPSVSFNELWLGLEGDPKPEGVYSSEIVYFDSYDLKEAYDKCCRQPFIDSVVLTIPTMLDPSLAPAGKHIVSVISPTGCPVPPRNTPEYEQYKQAAEKHLITLAKKINPNIPKYNVLVKELATPATFQRYTLNSGGAAYGWEATVEQGTINGLLPKTPIKGLFLSGHWTYPCGGIVAVMMSGKATAKIMLRG
ncbi:MAG: NAD(P)/FAD-dependent oxidoreductase [Candidatus Omnitrophica bacterium]|nr:NAD(P)/FAD-dependent oxidoreductase [Candidatus Omnitrophota bacterium]MDD5654715.1 NAD(P)/FAD-dependent oxidoreductase [Candidatus Omnitrophota bacterium]